MKYFPLIWAALWRKKLRTLFTFCSIFAAFLQFGLLQGVNSAFNRGLTLAHVDRMIVRSRLSEFRPIPIGYLSALQQRSDIKALSYTALFPGVFQEQGKFVPGHAVDPTQWLSMYSEVRLADSEREVFLHNQTSAIVGRALANRYGWKVGDRVPIKSSIWARKDGLAAWTFDIAGIYDCKESPSLEQLLVIRYSHFDEQRVFAKGTVHFFTAQITSAREAAEIGNAIDATFANSSNETKTTTERENNEAKFKKIGDINLIVTGIMAAVFFTLLFMTGNTMLQSIRERLHEFAVLRTLGFAELTVLNLIGAESFLLIIMPAVAGLGAALFLFQLVKGLLGISQMPLDVMMYGVLFAVGIAVAVCIPPALIMRRTKTVDALANR